MRKQSGFTLIEVMIVAAIIALLAGIGLPSYRNYVLRGQLANATADLSVLPMNALMTPQLTPSKQRARIVLPALFSQLIKPTQKRQHPHRRDGILQPLAG